MKIREYVLVFYRKSANDYLRGCNEFHQNQLKMLDIFKNFQIVIKFNE